VGQPQLIGGTVEQRTPAHVLHSGRRGHWDYAPSGRNQITGQPFGEQENVFVQRGPNRIGKVYTKALYREYTDSSFRQRKQQPPHLGSLGPIIRAEVGDTYAGLEGAIIITAAGKARGDGSPNDVDREFVTMFSVMDENQRPSSCQAA
jgi:hypothetical protein